MIIPGPNNELIDLEYRSPHQPVGGDVLFNNITVLNDGVITGSLKVLGYLSAIGGYKLSGSGKLYMVSSVSDLPPPINGKISLDGGAWLFTDFVDLLGNRLEFTGDTALLGSSSETSGITSTGLPSGSYLISGGHSIPIQNMRLTVPVDTYAFNLSASYSAAAIDWRAFNIIGGKVGNISGFSNFVMQDSAFINSGELVFGGNIGTIAFETTLFSNPNGTMIRIPSDAVVSRRFRIIYSSFVVTGSNVGLNISDQASIPVEGYILDTVNFSGGGVYVVGVEYSNNKSLWQNCRGINNSGEFAHMSMNNNSTVTDILSQGIPVKISGSTIIQPDTQKFSHSNNRLTYIGAITRSFKVLVTASINANNGVKLGLYVAKNGSVVLNSENYTTAGATNRTENALSQTVVSLNTGDYIEIFVENDSAGTDVTVTDLSVIVEALN